jgi:hypothetical protein
VPPGVVVDCPCGTTTVVLSGGLLLLNDKQLVSANDDKSAMRQLRFMKASLVGSMMGAKDRPLATRFVRQHAVSRNAMAAAQSTGSKLGS